MKLYTIEDLLVDTYYSPVSSARRYQGGKINFAEKITNQYPAEGYERYAVRYRAEGSINDQWATVSVKVSD